LAKAFADRGVVDDVQVNGGSQAGVARYGEPEEIAELMAFPVLPGACWITGASIRINGGEVRAVSAMTVRPVED
jgi:NAD(P)-dependent dehydrogenase (short-subunit alcohol dehydrogenase family)